MSEEATEREKALMTRIKELEAEKQEPARAAGEGAVEQVWRYFSAFIPSWIIAAGIAVFVAFHAWEYYNQLQITAAETEIKKAQAAIDDAKGRAANADADGIKIQVATLAAEVAKSQNEAGRAKVEADAQNALIAGETTRLQQVQAELANKVALAGKAKNAADAAGEELGGETLAKREAKAKLVIATMEGTMSKMKAAFINDTSLTEAGCEGNQFAEYIGCPARYVQAERQAEAERAAPKLSAATPAPAEAAAPVALRKPKKFDCVNASMGSDYVVCASPRLMDVMARLEDAYQTALIARGNDLRTRLEERAWSTRYGTDCGLPLRGRPASGLIASKTACVEAAMNNRIRALQSEQ